jgi:hypothetical protein
MSEHIDQLAENLARGMSRRKALGLFIGGVAGVGVGGTVGRGIFQVEAASGDTCVMICSSNYPKGTVAYAECLSSCSPCTHPQKCQNPKTCVTIEVCSGDGGVGGSGSGSGFGGSGSGSGSGTCLPVDICAHKPRN